MRERAKRWGRRAAGVALAAWAVGAGAARADVEANVVLTPVVDGLQDLIGAVDAGDGRLLVYNRAGLIRVFDGEKVVGRPFLDLRGRVLCCSGNQGLVGLALHPDYAANGQLFVSYSGNNGDSIVSRFRLSADPDRADRRSEEIVLRVPQPFADHNVGHIEFGPDGTLYVGSGDGGMGGDPEDDAQSLDNLLGKILRLDVDGAPPYAIPPDNPFAGDPEAREEIWDWGLRNPWRFSLDPKTGDLYIGDVGQDAREEIDLDRGAGGGGKNFGWKRMEGSVCFEPAEGCEDPSYVRPILEYVHGEQPWCSVIGGYRYRGPADPTLDGLYVYGDLCSGQIWGARPNAAGAWKESELFAGGLFIRSFGVTADGRLLVVTGRTIYRLDGVPLFASDFDGGTLRDWSTRRGGLELTAPGLGGSAGALVVRLDGTARRRFLRSNEPADEPTFRAGFTLDLDRVDLGGAEVEILRLVDGRRTLAALVLEPAGRRYRLALWAREGDGALTRRGATRIHPTREVRIGLDWMQATAPERSDGQVELLRNGRRRVRAAGLDNAADAVDAVLLGLPGGAAGAGPGAFRLDDYTSSP